MADLKNVELIKVGRWNASTGPVDVTSAMLDDIVSSFTDLNNKVPGFGVAVKLGHKTERGQEAMGWLSDLSRTGDTLVGSFSDMPPAIVDAVRERRYNSVSVEVLPRVTYAGKTYANVLGGVALLGAEWPAVKGLKPLSASLFAEAGEKIEIDFEENDTVNFTQEQHDAIMLAAVNTAVEAERAKTAKALTDAASALAASNQAKDIAEAAVKAFREEADKGEVDKIIETAEGKGQITPAMKPLVVALSAAVTAAVDPTKRKDAVKALSDFVKSLPSKVIFGESGKSKSNDDASSGQKASDQIDAEAKALLAADTTGKLDYAGAVQKVYALKPELKTAYAEEM